MVIAIHSKIPVLKWVEMGWWYDAPETRGIEHFHLQYLGEAGNSSRKESSQISAMRIGAEVIVQAPHRVPKDEIYRTIPAYAILEGFGEELDGKNLMEVMKEGVQYDYTLKRVLN